MSLAVFDFDGTLIEGDAGIHFARHMLQKGYIEALTEGSLLDRARDLTRMNWNAARLAWDHVRLHARYDSGDVDRRTMVEQAYRNFAGLERDVAEEQMHRFARSHLPDRLREDVVARLEEHSEKGDHVVVLSTGLHDLIWPLREVIGHDFETVACRLKDEGGRLTGAVEGPLTGSEKATRLVAIARRADHDLEQAHAYADHETDADMIELVGNPVAVHPTPAMRRRARREGWDVLA